MNAALFEPELLSDGSLINVVKGRAHVEVSRDRRTMNNMDPETKAIHIRLEEWGPWGRARTVQGYPTASPMEKAVLYGRLGIPQDESLRGEPQMPDHVARVDASVAKCCQIDQQVLKKYYQFHAPMEAIAREMRMRERQAQNVLRRARWRVSAFLAVLES